MEGSLVLITGGSGAIGRAVVDLFQRNGARVIVADLDFPAAQQLVSTLAGGSERNLAAKVDVGSSESVENLAEAILTHYNGEAPKIVVNSAGIVRNLHGLFSGSEEEWDLTLRVNLKGTFLINKKFIHLMTEQNIKGSVVNLSSMAMYGFDLAPSYSASKGGVTALTKAIAKEFGPKGIRVNAVAPVFIEKSMVDHTELNAEEKAGLLAASQALCPLKRIGKVEEVAELVYFLASDKASFITGDVHHLSGGFFS